MNRGKNGEAIRMTTEKKWDNKCARLRMREEDIGKTRMKEDMKRHKSHNRT